MMKVGAAVIFQNPLNEKSDYDVYRHELPMGDMAEPLGFDSLWSVEHHFDDYTMCPDVLQFLSYYAGRTNRIQLGSMVVVLPCFFFQAEDGIRDYKVTGVQTCALP